jgi:hypothetical protein
MLFGALTGVLLAATPAAADDTTPSWNCRASVLQVFGSAAEPRLEPLVANGDGSTGAMRPQCADDDAGLPTIDENGLFLHAVAAATRLTPPTGASRDQTASAGATVAEARFATPGNELVIEARTIQAGATARCVDGAPVFEGGSTVADLSVNGQRLPIDDSVLNEITQQINGSPLGGLIKVILNDKVQTADGLTVQAVRIELFSAAGSPQGTVVLGEAKVTSQGAACAPAQTTTPTDGTNGSNGSNGTNGSNGSNGTNGTNAPNTGSSINRPVNEVVINGSNGGCGRLKAWWEKVDLLHRLPGRPAKTTSRFGQRAMMRGQLVNCRTGKPIVGAILDQIHYVGKGVGKLVKTGIKTRSAGKFTYIEPLNLTTRRIVLVYRGNLNSQKASTKKTLRLVVRGKRGQIIRGKPPRTLE